MSGADLASVVVSDEGQFPDSVKEPPAMIANDPLFDVPALFESPPADENAAPLYLDPFYDVEPSMSVCFPDGPDRKSTAQNLSDRLAAMFPTGRDPVFNDSSRDAILRELQPVLRKVQVAQQRPKCMFHLGISINALIPHCQAIRNVQRAAVLRVDQALDQENFDQALDMIKLSFRMSRDVGARGGYICQLVTVGTEAVAFLRMVDPFLAHAKLKPEHTRRLAKILIDHRANRVDVFLTGNRVEYLSHRIAVHDIQHRTGMFAESSVGQVLRDYGLSGNLSPARLNSAVSRMTPAHFQKETDFLIESQRLVEELHGKPYAIRQHAWKNRDDEMRRNLLLIVGILASPRALFDDAATKGESRLAGYICVTAVKLYQQEHGQLPGSLAEAVKGIGLAEVPGDAYSAGKQLRFANVNNRLIVYSIGSDGIDQGGRTDWKFGQQPGDFLFPVP